MRAFTVLLALVATPFLAGVSQQVKTNSGVGHDAAHCAMRAALRPGTAINKCDPAPTQPPVVDPPVVTPPVGDGGGGGGRGGCGSPPGGGTTGGSTPGG